MTGQKKITWITGASSGIGKAIATEFVKNGVHVIGTARRVDLLKELQKELNGSSGTFEYYELDVTKVDSVDKFYKHISQNYFVECLINNAGITSFKQAVENSFEEIRDIIEVNLLGSIYVTQKVLPQMIENKSGAIINILSAVTQKVFTASSAYSASKNGLHAYAKVLREELRDKNVRVINISPGATVTEIWPTKVISKHSDKMMKTEDIAKVVYQVYSGNSNLVAEEIVLRPVTGDL
ncbi:MAG: SDR family oxidoreductase [Bacteroidetes bacterium]|nr:SDR family oxidoreductase [Bacteroidota bacterium]MCL6100330.1 SDR family oxidoreductase [Bacteroidota bacterium]